MKSRSTVRSHIPAVGRFATLLLFVSSVAFAAPEGPVTLRHAFTKGDKLIYSIEMEGAGTVEIKEKTREPGPPGKFSTDVENLIELYVTEVDKDGNAVIEGRIKDWEMKFNGNPIAGKNMPPSSADAPIIERMKKPFKMKVSAGGQMLEFDGELFDKDLFPFNAGGERTGWTASLPANPVKVGDTWEEDLPPIFHPVDEEKTPQIHYTLAGFETIKDVECAVIETWTDEADIRPGESDFSIPGFSGMNTKISRFTQNMEGTLYFAHEAGVLLGFEFSIDQTGDMEITHFAGVEPMKMKLNLKIDGIVNLE